MNVNDFDSKQHFKDSLTIAYDLGTFFVGMKVLSSMACEFFEPVCTGYQSDNYWIISNDVRYIFTVQMFAANNH